MIPPYGTVLVDYDNETVMSLGIIPRSWRTHFATIRLAPAIGMDGVMYVGTLRPVSVEDVDNEERWKTQEGE